MAFRKKKKHRGGNHNRSKNELHEFLMSTSVFAGYFMERYHIDSIAAVNAHDSIKVICETDENDYDKDNDFGTLCEAIALYMDCSGNRQVTFNSCDGNLEVFAKEYVDKDFMELLHDPPCTLTAAPYNVLSTAAIKNDALQNSYIMQSAVNPN